MDTTQERKSIERIFARGFTVIGGLFWITAAFAGPYVYRGQDALHVLLTQAIYPLVFTVAVLAIGWFYERIAAAVLTLGAVGTLIWGAVMALQGAPWEPLVWGIVLVFFVAPAVIAAALFYLAGGATAADSKTHRHAGAMA